MTAKRRKAITPSPPPKVGKWVLGVLGLTSVLFLIGIALSTRETERRERPRRNDSVRALQAPEEPESRYFSNANLTLVWDKFKPDVKARVQPTASVSNIEHSAYVGADACRNCHVQNHTAWSEHSHRWMNALATEETVLGDFGPNVTLSYKGGQASFYRDGGKFMMRYERRNLKRSFEIHQTIGSRFYQYYVGVGIEGPESPEHDFYKLDQVLPFGYWLERDAWVPVVHVSEEVEESSRWEPLETVKHVHSGQGIEGVGRSRGVVDSTVDVSLVYAQACNYCHTTFPLGDMMVRMPERMGPAMQFRSLFALSDFVAKNHPEIWDGNSSTYDFTNEQLRELTRTFIAFDAREEAASLGISCEACHLGCRQHAEQETIKPPFRPQAPELYAFESPELLDQSASAANVNAICARCHVGERPTYAAGMSTWNSTEHTDAMRGSCYSQLSCTDCHNPHQATGPKWQKSALADDQSCLKCHTQFSEAKTRALHTHHPANTPGDRCMNCHMPRINEGMQDVVRTHTIFSPTNAAMLEANQPNACNLCHLERTIDWTLGNLKLWYGKQYSEPAIAANYPDRELAVGVGWLRSKHEPTRLVAAEALGRTGGSWALSELLPLLDDPFLMVRQFAQTALESLLKLKLDEKFGYWYYMSSEEREPIIERIRAATIPKP